MTQAELIARYDGRVPRYTSYPTAPNFSAAVGADAYANWLEHLPADAAISLYLHVPFCERLCLYCGCNTTVVRNERPRRAYAEILAQEILLLRRYVGRRPVTAIHWGGGTPTTLPNDCLTGLMDLIRHEFDVAPDAEIAIEIDPAAFNPAVLDALVLMGVNRASLGVQDFEPVVQKAIGRPQSFTETAACADALRGIDIKNLNLDLIYGLPNQTTESAARTAAQALQLQPSRIAVFGYAHVPWMKRHQTLIDAAALPGLLERFAQSQTIAAVLERAGGFIPIGLDHYARPEDAMAQAAAAQTLHRNFQGYTTDAAAILIGLGASAIGALPQGYAQNAPGVPAYEASIHAGNFATVKGIALTAEDRLRRDVIERIMCDGYADLPAVARAHNANPASLHLAAASLQTFAQDGLLTWNGSQLQVTPTGRPFLRNIAAVFDAHLKSDMATPKYALAV